MFAFLSSNRAGSDWDALRERVVDRSPVMRSVEERAAEHIECQFDVEVGPQVSTLHSARSTSLSAARRPGGKPSLTALASSGFWAIAPPGSA